MECRKVLIAILIIANSFYEPNGPLEPVLISGFCSVKRMRVSDSPWTGH